MRLRRLAAATLAASLLAVPAWADDVGDDELPEQPVVQPRPLPPAPQPPRMPPQPPPRVEARPEARPLPRPEVRETAFRHEGFYFAPEALALRFDESDTDFATSASGADVEIESDWAPGGRLGVGYVWSRGWDVILRGTFVDASNEASASAVGGLGTVFGTFDSADALLDVEYLVADLEVGYTMGAPNDHRLRAFVGPRFAAVEQDLQGTFDPDLLVGLDRVFTRQIIDAELAGLRAGLEGHVAFGDGWSWFLMGAVSLLEGTTDVLDRRATADGTIVVVNTAREEDESVTVVEGQTGFTWSREAFSDGMFGVRFGYEVSQWDDLPTPADLGSGSPPDALGDDFVAHGGFVRAEWIF